MYLYLDFPSTHLILVFNLLFFIISSQSFETKNSGSDLWISLSCKRLISWEYGISVGISFVMVPSTIGIGERRFSDSISANFVFPWPMWPINNMSWPANNARFTEGMTVSSNPIIPVKGFSLFFIFDIKFSLSWILVERYL